MDKMSTKTEYFQADDTPMKPFSSDVLYSPFVGRKVIKAATITTNEVLNPRRVRKFQVSVEEG